MIKEVADVVFYSLDANGEKERPVLYLDSLKVSTIEQTAENVSARGGKGNAELVTWDYNKEINVTLEDALYSMKSMGVMFGDNIDTTADTKSTYYKTVYYTATTAETTITAGILDKLGIFGKLNGKDLKVNGDDFKVYDANGTGTSTVSSFVKNKQYFISAALKADDGTEFGVRNTIEISPDTFPGVYYVQGETYGRSEASGQDELFIFVINKAKVLSEVTLTLEAEGDPSTFNLNLKVLRPAGNKPMMELIQYGKNA